MARTLPQLLNLRQAPRSENWPDSFLVSATGPALPRPSPYLPLLKFEKGGGRRRCWRKRRAPDSHPPTGVNLCKLPGFLKCSGCIPEQQGWAAAPRHGLGSPHTFWLKEKTQVLRLGGILGNKEAALAGADLDPLWRACSGVGLNKCSLLYSFGQQTFSRPL